MKKEKKIKIPKSHNGEFVHVIVGNRDYPATRQSVDEVSAAIEEMLKNNKHYIVTNHNIKVKRVYRVKEK